MWVEAKNLCGRMEEFRVGEGEEAEQQLIRHLEPSLWRLKNITKNPLRDISASRTPLKAGSSVTINGVSIAVDATLVDEAQILSNIFQITDSHAVELLLSGEAECLHYDLNRGLLAVACYYDAHRMMAEVLRRLLALDHERTTRTLNKFVKENLINRETFKHLLNIQEQFTVAAEFHTLMNPQVNGLGGAKHQSILRNLIEETRSLTAECVYLLAQYDPDQVKIFLSELYPKLKTFPIGEKLSPSNMVIWICTIRLTSSDFLTQVPNASSVLMEMVQEIRDETAWSDQSICGTVQLACAVSFRALAASPADHLTTETVSFDVNRVLDRAVRNMCFHYLRLGIIGSDAFKQCATNTYIVNRLLTQIILHFPAKLIEIERNGEDELHCLDEMAFKKQQTQAFLHYEHFLRCIADLFSQFQDPACPMDVREVILNAAINYSNSLELCRFLERARLDLHLVHCVAYLDTLTALCLTRENAAFIFHIFNVDNLDGGFSWDRVMMALRDYSRIYRQSVGAGDSHMQGSQNLNEPKMEVDSEEMNGLCAWMRLTNAIVTEDASAARTLAEDRGWSVIDACVCLASSPVPLSFKGILFKFLAALAEHEDIAQKIWISLEKYQVCTLAENGVLMGLQKELEERECASRRFDCSVGFARLLRALFKHGNMPTHSPAYILFLTKSVLSQLAVRSYEDVKQMWELAEVACGGLLSIVDASFVDAYALTHHPFNVAVVAQLLSDTPLFRAICRIISEDCEAYSNPLSHEKRVSEAASLVALQLLSAACSRHSLLRLSIRSSESDLLLATLPMLLMIPVHSATQLTILDTLFLYLEQADQLPRHSLCAARILRDLSSVGASQQRHIVELLRSRHSLQTHIRAIRTALSIQTIQYQLFELLLSDDNKISLAQARGETARIILEIFSDAVEAAPQSGNICTYTFAFVTNQNGKLYEEEVSTGFHQLLSALEAVLAAKNPLDLPYSALVEPIFRLIQRLVSPRCSFSSSVLRFLRMSDFVPRLLLCPFLCVSTSLLSGEEYNDGSDAVQERLQTVECMRRLISSSVLHISATEITTLLTAGYLDKPKELYSLLLEASSAICKMDVSAVYEDGESNVDCLLFSLMKFACPENRSSASRQLEYPSFVHFDSHRLPELMDLCNSVTVFGISQFDVHYMYKLLRREIDATGAEETDTIEKEMRMILTYCTALNADLLVSGSAEQLISACAELLNVFSLFTPVPFIANKTQFIMLRDACFLAIEVASASTDACIAAVSSCICRLTEASCELAVTTFEEKCTVRQELTTILLPLLELIMQPSQRTSQTKFNLYTAAHACLRTCYDGNAAVRELQKTDEDWLLAASATLCDTLSTTISGVAHLIGKTIASDISNLPPKHKPAVLLLLADLLYEDSKGLSKLPAIVRQSGIPRILCELLITHKIVHWAQAAKHGSSERLNLVIVQATLACLTRLASSPLGWDSLAELSVTEFLCTTFADPPNQIYLEPHSVKKLGTASHVFAELLDDALHLCLALCTNKKWRKLSFKLLDVITTCSEVYAQLLRANVDTCDILTAGAILVSLIYFDDEPLQALIDGDALLSRLRQSAPALPAPAPPSKLCFVSPTSILKQLKQPIH